MSDNALISIIVPVYKVEYWLPKCIKSLMAQTYKNIEIILVDDGSPDQSGKICDKFAKKDSRIKVIHKENGGVSSARNAGIEAAGGEYLKECNLFDVYTGSHMDAGKKSVAFSLVMRSDTQTLTDTEADEVFQSVLPALKEKHGAVIRS